MLTTARCSTLVLSVAILVLQSCGTEGTNPIAAPADFDQPKPPESVVRMRAPADYKGVLTDKVNKYRAETYATNNRNPISHDDVLHTAATRHAVYLNTLNSAAYQVTRTGPSGEEAANITSNSLLTALVTEPIAPSTAESPYPTYFTSTSMYSRVDAVVGGPDLLKNSNGVGRYIFENYVFNGNITNSAGDPSNFRGFSLDSFFNATQVNGLDNNFQFDVVDNMWYTRRGRHALIQPTARFWGYGDVQSNKFACPWPILNGRFLGVGMVVADRPLTQQLGFWPNNGQTDVTPYGLDTDVWNLQQELGSDSPYGGPPIHFTLPVAEPFQWSGPNALSITFTCVAGYPAGWPERWKALAVFTNQNPIIAAPGWTAQSFDGITPVTTISFAYLSTVEDGGNLNPTNLRDGELYMQTLGPLPPNQEFRVTIRAATAQTRYELSWNFFTNRNSAYNP